MEEKGSVLSLFPALGISNTALKVLCIDPLGEPSFPSWVVLLVRVINGQTSPEVRILPDSWYNRMYSSLKKEVTVAQEKRHFIVTEQGRKTGVLLSLKEYRELIEDLQDLAIIAERKDEPSLPFEVVKERLERKWLDTDSK